MRLAVIPTHDDDAERNPDEAPAVAADSLTEAEKSPTHDRTSGGAGPQCLSSTPHLCSFRLEPVPDRPPRPPGVPQIEG